jgi:hypothetical protein
VAIEASAEAQMTAPASAFPKAGGVNADGTSTDAKNSVVRVICVRK